MAAATGLKPFHHQRLSSPRSIRILTLLPSKHFNDELETTTFETNLDSISGSNVSYEALSYVWGSRTGNRPLKSNGKDVLVTPNCESALRYLRQSDVSRFLWVDAICIDQGSGKESVAERNAQVAIMSEVYAKAKRTICWLGEGTLFTTEVFKHLHRIGQCPSKRGLKKLLDFDAKLRKDCHLHGDISCLDHIFCHPWHSRIWTVQELAFSTECIVVCGKAEISWELYTIAARFLIYDEFIYQLDINASKSLVGIDMRNVLRDYLLHPHNSDFENESENTDAENENDRQTTFLTSCLSDVNQLQATDPKDKIYGLYALYKTLGIPLPVVDYSKTLERVYEEATLAMISWSGSLKVLGDACSINRSAGLPSWVPDWQDPEIKFFAPTGNATEGSHITTFDKCILSPKNGQLRVMGIIVGRILEWDDVSSEVVMFPNRPIPNRLPILSKSRYDMVEVEILRLLVEKVHFLRNLLRILLNQPRLCNEREMEIVFHEILSLGGDWLEDEYFAPFIEILNYPNSQYDLSYGRIQAEIWRREDEATANAWSTAQIECVTIAASLLSNSIVHNEERLKINAELLDLVTAISGNLNDRVLIVGHNDITQIESIGTSFCSATVGDSIALLQGAEYPVLLRQTGANWRFVGPLAMYGMMEGETWSEVISGAGSLVEIILV